MRDIALAVTMSVLYAFGVLLARSVSSKLRTRPFRPLCREMGLFLLFFSWRGFLFRYRPHCLSEPRRASTCSVLFPPRLIVHRVFVRAKCSVPSPWVGVFSLYSVVRTFQPMVHCWTSHKLFRF